MSFRPEMMKRTGTHRPSRGRGNRFIGGLLPRRLPVWPSGPAVQLAAQKTSTEQNLKPMPVSAKSGEAISVPSWPCHSGQQKLKLERCIAALKEEHVARVRMPHIYPQLYRHGWPARYGITTLMHVKG